MVHLYSMCERILLLPKKERKKEREEGGREEGERKGKGDERRKEGRNYHPWGINMTK